MRLGLLNGRGPRGKAKAGENFPDCIRCVYGGEYPHLGATARAGEDVKLEYPRQDAAIEKGAKLPFDEPGDQTVALPLRRQKRFDMSGHNAIEYALFRPVRALLASAFAHGGTPVAEHTIGPLRFPVHFV